MKKLLSSVSKTITNKVSDLIFKKIKDTYPFGCESHIIYMG